MDLTFFLPPGDIFTALIFKENLEFWDSTLGIFLLDEEANASLLVTDDFISALLFMECLMVSEAFLLASEALLLAAEAFLLTSEAFLLASEALLLEAEAFLLASEALLLEAEAFLLASEALLLEAEALLLASEALLLEVDAFLLEAEAFLLVSEALLLEPEAFLLETDSFLLEIEAFFLESETLLLEAEAFLLEVEASLLENKAVSFIFGSEDIFIALTGTRFPFMRMDGISGFDFKEYPFFAIFLFERLFFFAIILGFAAILFGVFMLKETFLLLGEEVDFLDFLFLLEVEALLMSSSRSLLISRCILFVLDLTIFLGFQLELRWSTGEILGFHFNLY